MSVTIQKTNKGVKIMALLGYLVLLYGIINFSLLAFVAGIVIVIVARMMRWWHND